jgi:hypothetical protein
VFRNVNLLKCRWRLNYQRGETINRLNLATHFSLSQTKTWIYVRLCLELFVGVWCLIYVICICLHIYSGVQHILCCVFVLFVFVLCTLCCQFLWIVHSWLSLRFSLTFIYNIICRGLFLVFFNGMGRDVQYLLVELI